MHKSEGETIGVFIREAALADAPAPGVGELYAINLQPDAWRRGIGAQLLGAVFARLRESCCREAVLWVAHENAWVRGFCERFGWRGDGAANNDGGPFPRIA